MPEDNRFIRYTDASELPEDYMQEPSQPFYQKHPVLSGTLARFAEGLIDTPINLLSLAATPLKKAIEPGIQQEVEQEREMDLARFGSMKNAPPEITSYVEKLKGERPESPELQLPYSPTKSLIRNITGESLEPKNALERILQGTSEDLGAMVSGSLLLGGIGSALGGATGSVIGGLGNILTNIGKTALKSSPIAVAANSAKELYKPIAKYMNYDPEKGGDLLKLGVYFAQPIWQLPGMLKNATTSIYNIAREDIAGYTIAGYRAKSFNKWISDNYERLKRLKFNGSSDIEEFSSKLKGLVANVEPQYKTKTDWTTFTKNKVKIPGTGKPTINAEELWDLKRGMNELYGSLNKDPKKYALARSELHKMIEQVNGTLKSVAGKSGNFGEILDLADNLHGVLNSSNIVTSAIDTALSSGKSNPFVYLMFGKLPFSTASIAAGAGATYATKKLAKLYDIIHSDKKVQQFAAKVLLNAEKNNIPQVVRYITKLNNEFDKYEDTEPVPEGTADSTGRFIKIK
jgi:hypothetical protein